MKKYRIVKVSKGADVTYCVEVLARVPFSFFFGQKERWEVAPCGYRLKTIEVAKAFIETLERIEKKKALPETREVVE